MQRLEHVSPIGHVGDGWWQVVVQHFLSGNGANLQSNGESKMEVSRLYLTNCWMGWSVVFGSSSQPPICLNPKRTWVSFVQLLGKSMLATLKMGVYKDGPSLKASWHPSPKWEQWPEDHEKSMAPCLYWGLLGNIDYAYHICMTSHGSLSHVEMWTVNSMNRYFV